MPVAASAIAMTVKIAGSHGSTSYSSTRNAHPRYGPTSTRSALFPLAVIGSKGKPGAGGAGPASASSCREADSR